MLALLNLTIGSLLVLWPVLLLIVAFWWRNEVLAKRIRAGQDELKALIGQGLDEAATGRALGTENSFVAWRVDWAPDGVLRVTNTGRNKARSVAVKVANASGKSEKTVSSVQPGDAVDLGIVLAAADGTEVEITWRSELGRWTTERQTVSH